jgi:Zn2+/Cd2+-exporting ATPase
MSLLANSTFEPKAEKKLKLDYNLLGNENRELHFSILSGATLATGFVISFWNEAVSLPFLIAAYFFGSFYMVKDLAGAVLKGRFEIDFLMFAAAVGAGILNKWSEGALLLFLFSMGHALEHLALDKAHKSIAALADLAPKSALIRRDGKIVEVPVEDLQIGDVVVVKPNSKIAADGVIVAGSSCVDQSNITGESIPVEKFFYHGEKDDLAPSTCRVFSGTMNGHGYLEVKVTKATNDTTLSHLIRLVNEAKAQESPTQLFTEKVEKIYVPIVLTFVVLLNFAFLVVDEAFRDSFYRAITVLVVASPCALVLSTPSAVLSGIARAAHKGVLMKGGKPLEELGRIRVLAFDKTGTLTKGEPHITDVIPLNGFSKHDIIRIVVAVEQQSDHPLAKAIVKDGLKMLNGTILPNVKGFVSLTGRGVQATADGKQVVIGNMEIFSAAEKTEKTNVISQHIETLENQGKTTMLVNMDGEFVAILALMDMPRAENIEMIAAIRKLGIDKIVMLSGDNQRVADSVAAHIGITEAWGNLLPENKALAIKRIRKDEQRVAMVGDGVNDAPAMANSSVSIAMGAAGSDVALETADVALMADNLNNLPFAIGLSQKTRKIIKQNLVISLGVIAIMVPLALFGITSIGPAVLIHEGSTIVVVFNALRLLKYKLEMPFTET